MSLTELTSRAAVLAALREFDERGRELFLSRYGFNHARSYFLEYEGSRYDSKAIAGVAHGIHIRIWGHFARQTSAAAKPQSTRCLRDSRANLTFVDVPVRNAERSSRYLSTTSYDGYTLPRSFQNLLLSGGGIPIPRSSA